MCCCLVVLFVARDNILFCKPIFFHDGLQKMLIIMVLYCGIHKGNRKLPEQAMNLGIIGMLVWKRHKKFMKKEYALKNFLSNRL